MAHAYLKVGYIPTPSQFCNKVPFTSRKHALLVAKHPHSGDSKSVEFSRTGSRNVSPYLCVCCGLWHLSHIAHR